LVLILVLQELAELKAVLIKIAPAIGENPDVPIPEETVKMLAEALDANGDGKVRCGMQCSNIL
jgi:hypothetical protein